MKVIVDDKIPYIRQSIEELGLDVVYLDGASISPCDVKKDVDALIVRTRTRCNEALLAGSKVQLIITATIGYDHLDTVFLNKANIAWSNCPGCNASSVEQYMLSTLLLLSRDCGLELKTSTIGVVGCGNVGSRVVKMARGLGLNVLVYDPFLYPRSIDVMEKIKRYADVITFHVPLTNKSPYPTKHLVDRAFLENLGQKPFIINTSRGAVVDNIALLDAIIGNKVRGVVIDTWENEPHINCQLLEKTYLGTPHIAGYSADGKVNASNMALEILCKHFKLPRPKRIIPPPLPKDFHYRGNPLQLYNPQEDSNRLKAHPELFEFFRANYPLRRENFSS